MKAEPETIEDVIDTEVVEDAGPTLEERQRECAVEMQIVLDKHGFRLDSVLHQPTGNAIVAAPVLIDTRAKAPETD